MIPRGSAVCYMIASVLSCIGRAKLYINMFIILVAILFIHGGRMTTKVWEDLRQHICRISFEKSAIVTGWERLFRTVLTLFSMTDTDMRFITLQETTNIHTRVLKEMLEQKENKIKEIPFVFIS